jgi:predicted ATPase
MSPRFGLLAKQMRATATFLHQRQQPPERDRGNRERDADCRVAVNGEGPVERDANIVELAAIGGQPFGGRPRLPFGLSAFEQIPKKFGMASHQRRQLAGLLELRPPVGKRVLANNTLAMILWLQGLPDQAVRIAERNVDYAQFMDHELSLCNVLAQSACPVALLTGDLAKGERYVTMLLDHSTRHALPLWHTVGRCFEAVLRIRQGDIATGLTALRADRAEISEARFETRYLPLLAVLAATFCKAGDMVDGRETIDEALERCRRNEELWYLPELLRINGEILLQEGVSDASGRAEAQFLQSRDLAHRQEVLSWELRAATSLARLWHSQGRLSDARTQLASVYGRFTEGFDTADLRVAKHELGHAANRRD